MQISVSTPYRANSIVNIARAGAAQKRLQRFYTTLYLARWQMSAQRIPLVGTRLARELGRRAFPGISPARVVNAATIYELSHVGSRRILGKRWPAATANLMYRVKAQFDRAVANKLAMEPPAALVGMYGASLESFRAVKMHGGLAVLNFVNSHPAEHNRFLFEQAGLKAPHHEFIPSWISQRVAEELELADLVLVPSGFVAGQLVAHGVSSDKIATLPYGVDLRSFHPPQQREADRRKLECLYVGQISHRKGIPVLLDAARHCRSLSVRFRLIGPIVSPEVLNCMPDNVVYEGPSLPGGVAETMRQVDLFVLPTLEDSFALVIFEAMASALPVITTSHAGVSELIENGRDGLIVPPGDSVALAEAIVNLVEQPALRYRLGEAAREKVQNAHSWDDYGQAVLKTINDQNRG